MSALYSASQTQTFFEVNLTRAKMELAKRKEVLGHEVTAAIYMRDKAKYEALTAYFELKAKKAASEPDSTQQTDAVLDDIHLDEKHNRADSQEREMLSKIHQPEHQQIKPRSPSKDDIQRALQLWPEICPDDISQMISRRYLAGNSTHLT